MGIPECSRYADTLNLIRGVIAAERAAGDLRRYLVSFDGGQFDKIIDRRSRDEFTGDDFRAVRKLNVAVLRTTQAWLLGEGCAEVRGLLCSIPADLDIWDIQPEEYSARLGSDSPAWRLWQLLFDKQEGARSAGRGVTAGKLLHGKRPRLIPVFDRQAIGHVLKIRHEDAWEVMSCALRQPDILQRLTDLRSSAAAEDLSLLRILDIVAW